MISQPEEFVDALLARCPATTMTLLVALVVGALRAPIVQAGGSLEAGWTAVSIALFLAASVVGAVIVLGIERAAGGEMVA